MILAIAIAALILALGSTYQVWRLSSRLKATLGSSSGGTIEKQLREHHAKNKQILSELEAITADGKQLATIASLSIQKIAVVRFNPFGDVGGDQSFSLAMLDGHDSGLVLTSIHGRGGTRVYAKPIDYGKSKYSLSQEEKKALAGAIKRIPKTLLPKGA